MTGRFGGWFLLAVGGLGGLLYGIDFGVGASFHIFPDGQCLGIRTCVFRFCGYWYFLFHNGFVYS